MSLSSLLLFHTVLVFSVSSTESSCQSACNKMKLNLILIFACLLLGVVVSSHAATIHPSEVYWQNALPNTPMPKAVRDLLRPDVVEEIMTAYNYRRHHKGKPVTVKVLHPTSNFKNYGRNASPLENDKPVTVKVLHPTDNFKNYGINASPLEDDKPVTVKVLHPTDNFKNYGINASPLEDDKPVTVKVLHPTSNFKNYGINASPLENDKPVTVKVLHPTSNFKNYGRNASPLENDPTSTPFFLEKDLHPGTKITNLHFLKTSTNDDGAITFLPQKFANQIPFSSNKLPQVLNKFSIDPKSEEAKAIKESIRECEEPATTKEKKYCATSLESMIEFSTSNVGKNVNVLPTEIIHDTKEKITHKQQDFIMTSGIKKMGGGKSVVCHAQTYFYAVFYCHVTNTRAYLVPMVSQDNATKIKVVAVCHTDTSTWSPKHVAFQVLKVKPGTFPICHFLDEHNIVWVAKNYGNY